MRGEGLRARKKAATRAAIGRAALRLAMEQGVDRVTTEAIAAAAEVSPRTFHNYFASKEEAIVSTMLLRAARMPAALAARPPGECVWDGLERVVLDLVTGRSGELAELLSVTRLVQRHPALVASQLGCIHEMQRELAEVIAARTGTDSGADLYPHLMAAAAGTVLRATLALWVDGGVRGRPAEVITEAFAQLRAGLPEPATRDPAGRAGPPATPAHDTAGHATAGQATAGHTAAGHAAAGHDAAGQATAGHGAAEHAAAGPGAAGQATAGPGAAGHATARHDAVGQAAAGHGAAGQATAGHGAARHDAVGQAAAGHGAAGQATAGHATAGHGAVGQAAAGVGAAGHGGRGAERGIEA